MNLFLSHMNKLFFLSVAILVNGCVSCQNNKSTLFSENAFTKIFLDSLKKKNPGSKYTIKQDLQIDEEKGEANFTHFLDNAYTMYRNEPDSISAVINLYLRAGSDLSENEKPIQKNRIIPVIKDSGYINEMAITLNKMNKPDSQVSLVFEKYNEKLVIVYAEDNENGIAYFTDERFRELGINRDSLQSIALRNLDNVLPEIQIMGGNGYYMLTAGGNYETSLILLSDIWTNKNLKVKGDIVIAIPTRDLLLVTGSKDAASLKKLRAVAREAWETEPYQLTPDLFRWNGKKFEPFE